MTEQGTEPDLAARRGSTLKTTPRQGLEARLRRRLGVLGIFGFIAVVGVFLTWFPAVVISYVYARVAGQTWDRVVALQALLRAVLFGVAAPFLILLLVCFHELGHLLAGWLVGFRFSRVRLGPFEIKRTSQGVRLGIAQGTVLGGNTRSLTSSGRAVRLRFAIHTAGGPLSHVPVAAVCWGALHWSGIQAGAQGSLPLWALTFALQGLMFVSLANVLFNGIPFRRGDMRSDGLQILDCLRGGPVFERQLVQMSLWDYVLRRVPPRCWPASLVHRAVTLTDAAPQDRSGFAFAYLWALDRDAVAEAGAYMDQALLGTEQPTATKAARAWCLEAAFFTARYRDDAQTARAWLPQTTGAWSEGPLHLRAEAAIFLREQRYAEALAAAERGLEEAVHSGAAADAVRVRDLRAMVAEARLALGLGQETRDQIGKMALHVSGASRPLDSEEDRASQDH